MKRLMVGIMVMVGCLMSSRVQAEDWISVTKLRVSYPMMISGTYRQGSNSTEPKPAQSEYLKVNNAGMVLVPKGAGFYLDVFIKKLPETKYYVTISYPNPADPQHPLVTGVPFDPTLKRLQSSSPGVIQGVVGNRDYDIVVKVYRDQRSMILMDTLTQKVRAYVDTRSGDVRVYRNLEK